MWNYSETQRHKSNSEYIFHVNSRSERDLVYTVDMHLGSCSCPQGINGAPCSHPAAISNYCHVYSINAWPNLFPERHWDLAIIALGKEVKTVGILFSIHQKAEEAAMKSIGDETDKICGFLERSRRRCQRYLEWCNAYRRKGHEKKLCCTKYHVQIHQVPLKQNLNALSWPSYHVSLRYHGCAICTFTL